MDPTTTMTAISGHAAVHALAADVPPWPSFVFYDNSCYFCIARKHTKADNFCELECNPAKIAEPRREGANGISTFSTEES
jgi:hypothetical protein